MELLIPHNALLTINIVYTSCFSCMTMITGSVMLFKATDYGLQQTIHFY